MKALLVHGIPSRGIAFNPPVYLKAFDVEAHDGRGEGVYTHDAAEAFRFADLEAVYREWNRVSKRRPFREDGRPNKPLAALTVEIVEVPA